MGGAETKNAAAAVTLPWRLRSSDIAKLQRTRAYDLLMRLPLLAWAVFCTIVWMSGLAGYVRKADPMLPAAIYAINVAMRLSSIAFLLLVAASVVLRTRPSGSARGFEPRISALAGSFIVYAFVLFPRRDLSVTAEIVSTWLNLVGTAAAVLVLAQLGRSFSVMAEARRLVTSGVYRFVRHPLYVAEELATVGIFMQFLSGWTALLVAVQIAFQLRRMHNEEAVLAATFPEYAAYQARTARLIPGIY
jgi:protein-S-isoprenylcysteine O-methyltransferase Ste14